MLKKITSTISAVVLSVAVLAGLALAGQPVVIKFSHVAEEDTAKGQMANKFRELVAERLDGKVVVKVYPNAQIFGDNNVLEAMLLGDVQMAAPSLSKFTRYSKKIQLFDLPFLFEDMHAVERFQQSSKGQQLLDSLKIKGLVGLGYVHDDLKIISSNKPLQVPGDAAGLRFRIQSSDVLQAQFRALKATSVKKPFSQVLTLLQDHSIDGQENTWSNIYSKKLFEAQPYITVSHHGLVDSLVVTSNEFWLKLDDDVRVEVKKALDEAIIFGNKVAAVYAISARQKIIDSKRCKIITLSGAERAQWVKIMQPVWQEFDNEIGRDLIDAAYRSNRANDDLGYRKTRRGSHGLIANFNELER